MSTSSPDVQSQYIRVLERLKDLVEENKRLKSIVESNEGESKIKIQKQTKTIVKLEKELKEYEARIGDLNVLLHRKGKDALRTEWEMSRMKSKVSHQEEEMSKLKQEAEEASSRWISEIREAEERSKILQVKTEDEVSRHYENIMNNNYLLLEDAHKHACSQYREELREREESVSRFEKSSRTMTLEMKEMEASVKQLNHELLKLRNSEHIQNDPVTRDETNDALVSKLQRENARLDDELSQALRRIAELERIREQQHQQQLPPRESQSQQQKRRPRIHPQQQQQRRPSSKKVLPRLSNNSGSGKHRHWATSASPLTIRRRTTTSSYKKH